MDELDNVSPFATINENGKSCSRCQRFLPFSEFRPSTTLKSGWGSQCRGCRVEANRRWRAENPEVRAAYDARRREEYRAAHAAARQHVCSECGVTFVAKADAIVCSRNCKDRRWRRLNPDQHRAKMRRYYHRRKARLAAAALLAAEMGRES